MKLNQDDLQSSGQISIIPKPELRGFWGSSLIKPPFRVTSADVVIICPESSLDFFMQPQPGEFAGISAINSINSHFSVKNSATQLGTCKKACRLIG